MHALVSRAAKKYNEPLIGAGSVWDGGGCARTCAAGDGMGWGAGVTVAALSLRTHDKGTTAVVGEGECGGPSWQSGAGTEKPFCGRRSSDGWGRDAQA